MKLRSQLALLVTFAIVASLAVAITFITALTRRALENEARMAALDAAEEIARDLQRLPYSSDDEIEHRIETALRKHRRLSVIELELAGEAGARLPRLDASGRRRAESGTRTLSATAGEAGQRGIEASVPLNGRTLRGRITVTLSLELVDRLTRTQSRLASSVAILAVLLAALIAVSVADRVVGRPLSKLVSTMEEVSRGALDRRVSVAGPVEVQQVSEAFNRMLGRLEEADRAVRSFNERLAEEVRAATAELSERNTTLARVNQLLVRAREDLAHKERLAALGQLAAQLAHEMGTPLGSVSGHLQLAMATPACPADVRERLDIAHREVARVGRIIRDYLDATRRFTPEIRDVDIARTVREAVDVARGGRPERSAPTRVDVAPEAARWRSDEGIVRQLLVNLVANALDAVAGASRSGEKAGGGTVAVSARVEEPKLAGRPPERESELVLCVEDGGPGLAPEALARMFEPFYTTKGRGKGTGLGLAICRELVHGLGGRIEVASEPGRGTVFTARLPPGDELVQRARAADEARAAARPA